MDTILVCYKCLHTYTEIPPATCPRCGDARIMRAVGVPKGDPRVMAAVARAARRRTKARKRARKEA